jgi:DNA-binding GntR family transcriptional regulator
MSDESLTALLQAPDDVVRERALLVKDAIAHGAAQAAREHGVSRRTATKWLSLYRSGGASRLVGDTPDQRRATAELRRAILTAPLWMPTTKWSSRSIASTLGVSQSYVARTWSQAASDTEIAENLSARDLIVAGLLITTDACALVLRPPSGRRGHPHVSARPTTQRRLRALLAADLVRDRIDEHAAPGAVPAFWDRITASCGRTSELVVVTSAPATVPIQGVAQLVCRLGTDWQSLLPCLSGWREESLAQPVAELEAELRRWHQSSREPFAWVAAEPTTSTRLEPTRVAVARSSAQHAGPERVLADAILATIRQGVAEGQLAGGDSVTERHLAGKLRTTRAQVGSALRLLERDGLVTVTTGHAAVVPVPTVADVVETYAARRALGALMVRAATRWAPAARASVLEALAELDRSAEQGDIDAVNQLDLTFQNALTEASGLARIGPMLQLLAEQVWMFVAVIGIRYAFPIDRTVTRDHQIVAAIDEGNGQLAVECWRTKMDEAVAYMVEQLETAYRRRPA